MLKIVYLSLAVLNLYRCCINLVSQWGTTDIQSGPMKLPPLFRAPAVWVVPV